MAVRKGTPKTKKTQKHKKQIFPGSWRWGRSGHGGSTPESASVSLASDAADAATAIAAVVVVVVVAVVVVGVYEIDTQKNGFFTQTLHIFLKQ